MTRQTAHAPVIQNDHKGLTSTATNYSGEKLIDFIFKHFSNVVELYNIVAVVVCNFSSSPLRHL